MQRQPQQKPDPLPAFPLSSIPPAEVRLGSHLMFPEEVILPEQLSSPLIALKHGVGALISAVLIDAVICFKRHIKEKNPRSHRLGREAEEWFFRNDHEWPFSFISICDALNLDPGYIKRNTPAFYSASLFSSSSLVEPERATRDPCRNSACARDAYHGWRDALGIFSCTEPVATGRVGWEPEVQPSCAGGLCFPLFPLLSTPNFCYARYVCGIFPRT